MRALDDMVRERRLERQRERDRVIANAIIAGVLRDLRMGRTLAQLHRERAVVRDAKRRQRHQERDHRLAISIINGVMARMGMPWPEIEAKAGRGWRVGGGLRRQLERC